MNNPKPLSDDEMHCLLATACARWRERVQHWLHEGDEAVALGAAAHLRRIEDRLKKRSERRCIDRDTAPDRRVAKGRRNELRSVRP